MEKQKVGKYLTDMKELPPELNEEKEIVEKPIKKKPLDEKEQLRKTMPVVENPKKEPIAKASSAVKKGSDVDSPNESKEKEASLSMFSPIDIILGIINFITIILLIYLLTRLPIKSKELQTEKIKEIKTQANSSTQYANLKNDLEKAAKLNSLFLDQSGVVDFVGAVEKLKSPGSSIQKVSFASQLAVKDKQGIYGVPVVIELRGSWQAIAPDLEKIQNLPYLFRPVNIEAKQNKDDPAVIEFNYGGILYVSDKFGKN